jgi:ATP-dependent DNA helicase RecG
MNIEELLNTSIENPHVEFKVDVSSPAKIAKDYVAFSNTADGYIVIGVDDKTGEIKGVEDPQTAADAVTKAIYDRTEPKLSPVPGLHSHDKKNVLVVEVPYYQGAEPVKWLNKNAAIVVERVGGISMPVDDDGRLKQIIEERRGNAAFDQLAAPKATLDDLDLEAAREAFGEVDLGLDDNDLQTYGLAIEQNKELVPTNAGILLFGKHPEKFHPDARFRGVRFEGVDRDTTTLDQADLRGVPLVRAIDEITHFIRKNTGTAQVLESGSRRHRDIPHYDEGILREVLHNAVAHADYSIEGAHLNVQIFSDKITIDSPGKWLSGMSERQLRAGISRTRNRAIVRIMDELNMIELRGSIFAKAQTAERERGYPVPTWSDPGLLVRVTIPIHPAAAGTKTGGAEATATGGGTGRTRRNRKPEVLGFLAGQESASAQAVADAVGVTRRRAQQLLNELLKAGHVDATGETTSPDRAWYITEAGRRARGPLEL